MTALHALLCSTRDDRGPTPGRLTEDVLGVSDAEVVAAIRAANEAVFERMYRAFRPRLIAIASAYVTEAIAEEIAQDVLLYVWERRDSWAPTHGVAVYLYASVRNRALKQLRHQGIAGRLERAAAAEDDEGRVASGATDPLPDVQAEHADLLARVDQALARLPELGRTAFTLRWIHQLAYDEIATIMGMSAPAVRKQVSRAREALFSVLGGATP